MLKICMSKSHLNSKMTAITPLQADVNGVINFHGLKIVYGSHPLNAFTRDTASGGYKAEINIASHKLSGSLWGIVTPKYPIGHPYVSIGDITTEKITLLSDASVANAYAQWAVIGQASA